MSNPFRSRVLLSAQRGLLDRISGNIRRINVEITEKRVHFRFIFDGAISEDDLENISEFETEVLADMEHDVIVSTESERHDNPLDIGYREAETGVFARLEKRS